jgi:uncharacterized protein YkwD
MRKIFFAIVFILAIGLYFHYAKPVSLINTINNIKKSSVYIEKSSNIMNIKDWTSDDVLSEINSYRESNGLSKLVMNDKLSQAARARLSVISEQGDVSGSSTGVTNEVAVKDSGYSFSLLGEIVTLDMFKTNDPITIWTNDTSSKNTLDQMNFRDIGIAVKNSGDKVSVGLLLASPKKIVKAVVQPKITWGGPELWAVVNKRRVESGVNPLKKNDELCTIASIRLNQLLELGKLDGHAGFVPLLDRPDLKPISEKYNVSEYLVSGYATPEEAVKAWEDTMGHKSLIVGGEYVWGCVYAQNTFGVAIAAY